MSAKNALILVGVGLAVAGYGLYRRWAPAGMPQVVMATGESLDGSQVRGPVRATLLAATQGRDVHFGISLADADGRAIRSVNMAGTRRPEPEVTIVDQDGKVVHQGRFKYG